MSRSSINIKTMERGESLGGKEREAKRAGPEPNHPGDYREGNNTRATDGGAADGGTSGGRAAATQLKEAEDRHLRLMAEFDNYRRRTQKERESIYPDAVADTVKELLPVLDNFQRALTTDCSDEEYKKGVQMTYNGLMEILKKQGLAEFGEAGEEFDPAYHNAVMHIEDEAKGKNVISQVFQRGYYLGDRVLRYAMVQTSN
ncbi:MAG: nucleotide exchange factor GrpE [Angelakisella sp.]